MGVPKIITGGIYEDDRGRLSYNNNFDLDRIKRMYIISNADTSVKRGWQAHFIESRWFQPISGSFKIDIVLLTDENRVSKHEQFEVHAKNGDVLYVPPKHATCISALTSDNSLMVYSDFRLGVVKDEHRFNIGYFNILDLEND